MWYFIYTPRPKTWGFLRTMDGKHALNEIRHSFVQEFLCSLGFGELGAVLRNWTPVLSDVCRISSPSANHWQAQHIIQCHYKTLSGGRGNIMAMFLGERITNNARKILVVRPQGIEPRIAGYKPGATNHITLGAYIKQEQYRTRTCIVSDTHAEPYFQLYELPKFWGLSPHVHPVIAYIAHTSCFNCAS